MTLEIQVLGWDRHKLVAGLNRLMRFICLVRGCPLNFIDRKYKVIQHNQVLEFVWFMVFNNTFNNISVILELEKKGFCTNTYNLYILYNK